MLGRESSRTMRLRRKVGISLLAGIGITGIGFGIATLGAWGPCGPGDTLAVVGALMSVYQLALLESVVPPLRDLSATISHPVLHLAWQLLFPVVFWSAAVLGVWTLIRCGSRQAQPCAAPNGGPATPPGHSGVTEGPPSVS